MINRLQATRLKRAVTKLVRASEAVSEMNGQIARGRRVSSLDTGPLLRAWDNANRSYERVLESLIHEP